MWSKRIGEFCTTRWGANYHLSAKFVTGQKIITNRRRYFVREFGRKLDTFPPFGQRKRYLGYIQCGLENLKRPTLIRITRLKASQPIYMGSQGHLMFLLSVQDCSYLFFPRVRELHQGLRRNSTQEARCWLRRRASQSFR